jgi:hypothetical protein
MSKIGTSSKKVVFYESDKKYADFRIALKTDGFTQANFMRTIIHAYIRRDKDLMPFIEKMLKKEVDVPRAWVRQSRMKRESAEEKMKNLGLSDTEIDNIFDLIADQE